MDVDAALVSGSLDDPDRFGEVFGRYYQPVWTFLARLGGAQVADDLTGQVFVSAFETRYRFDPERGSVKSWLYGIASNMARTRFRSDRRASHAFRRLGADCGPVDPADLVSEVDALRLESIEIRRRMFRLAADDCEIIVLAAWEELTYAEIAEILGVPVGTVRSRLSRARSRLRELLPESGEVVNGPQRGAEQ